MKKFLLLVGFSAISLSLFAQHSLRGRVTDQGEPLPLVNVQLLGSDKGGISNEEGYFTIENLPPGDYLLMASHTGYQNLSQTVKIAGKNTEIQLQLSPDLLGLEEVVVSANRREVARYDAPVIVNRIGRRVLENTQSLSLSEGLNFSPGLRLENNCQNCGFTQVRINGLEGAYSQVLINSRPVFSALAGVYGLEMIPTSMIERVEVVRGGGSALYGGNAIAGTINIITKDPVNNSFEVGSQLALTALEAPDYSLNFNGSLVDEAAEKGFTFYGFRRNRQAWDANADGFTEITSLQNQTLGLDAFYKPDERSKLQFNLFSISESRRGGSHLDRPPHQASVAEQLQHQILSANLTYERFSINYQHKLSAYASAQTVRRDSYYGGGGRILTPADSLTETDLLAINAYGHSDDLSLVSGGQYTFAPNANWLLTLGSEYQLNDVTDRMPGYGRSIDQQVGVLGNYAQLEINPASKLSLLLGSRLDIISIRGSYLLEGENYLNERRMSVLVPRASLKYDFSKALMFRLSYAQGYRAPQAFDEDLHIETVGGAARFTRLSEELETERSDSYTASLNYSPVLGEVQSSFVLEGFYTRLSNPFITASPQELPNGVAVVTKRNGSGAMVQGLNLETNFAFSRQLSVLAGGTWQAARYEEAEEIWAPAELNEFNQDSLVSTDQMLRTPNLYGYMTANWNPVKAFNLSFSSVYTGHMEVPHVVDAENEFTIIRETPAFLELNFKTAYTLSLHEDYEAELYLGMHNLLNSYQQDFDIGPERDAGYIYGPARPRTFFLGMKLRLQ
ncbi:MAG: TonB-dependent receptor [Cyclobacteriaceae bacterium]